MVHLPAKAAPFGVHITHVHDLVCKAIVLHIVFVYQRCNVIKMVERRKHRRLPYLSFIHLPVAHYRISMKVLTQPFSAQGHTASGRHTNAQ